MGSRFKMSDLGLLKFYLGIEVRQGSDNVRLSLAAYARKILEWADMASCNPCQMPMEAWLKLSKSAAPAVDTTDYQGLVSCLCYLVHTRLDITFVVGYMSRFMERLTTEHLNAMKRILCYIVGMITYCCHYKSGTEELKLLGYTDADMRGDVDTRKSTTGSCSTLDQAR
jgi:hypothetical protein